MPRLQNRSGCVVTEASSVQCSEHGDTAFVRFACNAVVVGRHVVLDTGCPQLEAELDRIGMIPHSTELGEFIKAGGSAKCLTLRLDGEDAAIWP